MARAVITGKTGTFAVILSDITNPVYFDLIRGAEQVAAAAGRTLVLAESQESPEAELAIAQRLRVSVDGLVLVASRLDDDQIQSLAELKPVAVVNRVVENIPSVVPDISGGLEAALEHLHALGHRSVGYLAGPQGSWMNRLRWSTVFDQAISRGMAIVELTSAAPTLEGGSNSLKRILASGVTAVITYNDLMAMWLLSACRAEGIDVPGRLSVVGFDDIFGSNLITPALTTIRSPLSAVGARAISMVMDGDGERASELDPLTTVFVPRESSGPPRR